jgi:hypothetical protein
MLIRIKREQLKSRVDFELGVKLYSLGMALGYTTEAKGKTYPRKERIDRIVKNAEISAVVHGGKLFLAESEMYDFLLESKSDVGRAFRRCATKKHIIENERKYKVRFVDICNEILS